MSKRKSQNTEKFRLLLYTSINAREEKEGV